MIATPSHKFGGFIHRALICVTKINCTEAARFHNLIIVGHTLLQMFKPQCALFLRHGIRVARWSPDTRLNTISPDKKPRLKLGGQKASMTEQVPK